MNRVLARQIALALGTALVITACGTTVDTEEEPSPPRAGTVEAVEAIQSPAPTPSGPVQERTTQDSVRVGEHPMPMQTTEGTRRSRAPESEYAVADTIVAPQPYFQNRENYAKIDSNPVHRAAENPVSTLSIDVDTGAYANVRRYLDNGQLPPRDAVRVEELINYFDYQFETSVDPEVPFAVTTEVGPNPWNKKTLLMQVGVQGYDVPEDEMPAANLVFLVDVSGSMQSADKLELLKSSLKLLTKQLDKEDRVSIVVYAGRRGPGT